MTNTQKVKHAIAVLKELEKRAGKERVVNIVDNLYGNLISLRHLLEIPHVPDGKKTEAKTIPGVTHDLAVYLLHLIKKRKSNFRVPDMNKWVVDMDKIIRIDGRTTEGLREVIEWCQQDEFWQNNILSPAKLRKQLDRLELQMDRDHKWKRNRRIAPVVNGKTAKQKYLEGLDDTN